jgi:hypothetical protein
MQNNTCSNLVDLKTRILNENRRVYLVVLGEPYPIICKNFRLDLAYLKTRIMAQIIDFFPICQITHQQTFLVAEIFV